MTIDVVSPTLRADIARRSSRRRRRVGAAHRHAHLNERRTGVYKVLERGLFCVGRVRRPERIHPCRWDEADPLASQRVRIQHRTPVRRCVPPGSRSFGIGGSTATTTLSTSARSGTERAMTPPKSVRYVRGINPVPLSRPSVPRRVTRLAALDGPYRESPVCDPIATAAKHAANALAEPPLDAMADFDGLNTFHTWPHASLE